MFTFLKRKDDAEPRTFQKAAPVVFIRDDNGVRELTKRHDVRAKVAEELEGADASRRAGDDDHAEKHFEGIRGHFAFDAEGRGPVTRKLATIFDNILAP